MAALKANSPLQFADYVRRSRYGLSGGITGQMLAAALNAFDGGDLREASLIWEKQCSRDDKIKCVRPKREKAVSRREWQVLTSDDSGAAKAHAKALTHFWNNIRAVNAWDRNEKGGFALLVRQMMSCVSVRYAPHHLVWQPSRSELGCTFEFVPLRFFENRTGVLRFCPTGMEPEGMALPEDEWMITVGDGLMTAGSIGAFAKADCLTSWLTFNEAFGMPGVLGKTKQGKDTAGGQAMADAVEAFISDWRGVLYGDDGTGTIELIRADGSAGGIPFPALLERTDRALSALWRGADLSSMSSGAGAGTGASLQDGETEILEVDDALMISERLNEIERLVIGWYFGRGVKPKAYIRLLVPQSEDLKLLLEATEKLVMLGAPIGVADVLERFGFPQPKANEELLGEQAEAQPDEEEDAARINADMVQDQFMRDAARLLAKASFEDRAELTAQLREVLRNPDERVGVALNSFIERLPEQIGKDAEQVAAWERILGAALIGGWAGDGTQVRLNARGGGGRKAPKIMRGSIGRGAKFDESKHKRGPGGKFADKPGAGDDAPSKSAKAKQNAVRVGREEQQYADELERDVAKGLGGVSFKDSEPVDVVVGKAGVIEHGVEFKAVISGKNDKLTMNTYAQIRKVDWEKRNKSVFHTVVRDVRDGRDVYFYRRGIAGSARLGSLHEAKSISEVKKLMMLKEKDLPAAARRTDKHLTSGRWKFFEDAEGKGYRDLKTGAVHRAKK